MFKKGDKVRCIKPDPPHSTMGRIYTVQDTFFYYGVAYVRICGDNGMIGSHFATRFEPTEEEEIDPSVDSLVEDPKHPSHYSSFPIEPLTFIMKNNLSFPVGCIIKYACRYDKKDTPIEDLKKIQEYAQKLIDEIGVEK